MRTKFLLKGLFTLAGLGLSVFTTVKAEPVNIETAIKAASTQIQVMDQRCKDGGLLHSAYVIRGDYVKPLYDEVEEELLAYVFELAPQGFVVVTADDDLVPIIAYSEHGSFCWEEHPENILLNMLRQDLSLRLEALPLIEREIIERNHRHWEGLIEGDPLYLDPGDSWPEAGSTWTGGWVESAWHQGSPYNDLCPIDPESGERCKVGCVATAMAQIINYWQYPSSVTFTEKDNYITDSLEIEIHAPDASISYIDYNDGNPSDEMGASISFACGVGAKMDYSSGESSAEFFEARNSLLRDFLFLNVEYKLPKEADFYIILEENMKASIPAILSVKKHDTSSSKHAIICDGFRKTEEVNEWHLNFGWGEDSPDYLPYAWYSLPKDMSSNYSIVNYGLLNIYAPKTYTTGDSINANQVTILQCFPNPFTHSTEIMYTLPQEELLEVGLYDASGRCIRNWRYKHDSRGVYGIRWNGKDYADRPVPGGAYFIRITAGESSSTYKISRIP